MQPVIIADASCLILLENIGELSLLQKLYNQILITKIIASEFGLLLPDWIVVQNPINVSQQQLFEQSVDRGEASAIALAMEQKDCLLIMDDLLGRKLAMKLQIAVTGTLGVIIEAKLNGTIASVKPILNKIKQTDFRMSESLVEFILSKANE